MLGMRLESVRPNRATRIKHANPSNAVLAAAWRVIDSTFRAQPFIAELLLFHGRTFREQHTLQQLACRELHNN